MRAFQVAGVLAYAAVLGGTAFADDWNMNLTVDNQFDVYFGTPMATNFYAGGGNNWTVTYSFNAFGRLPTDYLYVATASDHRVAQGFIGSFQNITTGQSNVTDTVIWEVFPAGAYAATNPFWPNPWPASLMPTQAQVDTAIAYATTNNLWVQPSTRTGGAFNGAPPWGFRPGIPANAQWIWYNSNGSPDPLQGFNHDEFLVFRVVGIPAPGALAVLGLAGAFAARRRR